MLESELSQEVEGTVRRRDGAAGQVCLRERISGTPQPTGVTGAPFYTAFRVEFCVAKQHYSTHLSTLRACSNRQPVTAVFRLDNQPI